MKIAIITCHSSGNASLAAVTARNKWDYSARHGYDLITLRMSWDDCKAGMLDRMAELLPIYDAIMVIGSDVIFTNPSVTIESLLHPGDSVVMAREEIGLRENGWSPINNDVAIWVNSPASLKLIREIKADSHKWLEDRMLWQGWVCDWVAQNPHQKTLRLVEPRVMNSFHGDNFPERNRWRNGDYIVHFACYGNDDKEHLARIYVKELAGR